MPAELPALSAAEFRDCVKLASSSVAGSDRESTKCSERAFRRAARRDGLEASRPSSVETPV